MMNLQLITMTQGVQGIFQTGDMIPIALNQHVSGKLDAQFGHPALDDGAFGVLNGARQFHNQIWAVFTQHGNNKLHVISIQEGRYGLSLNFTI